MHCPLLLCLASLTEISVFEGWLMVWQGEALPLLQETDYWSLGTVSRKTRRIKLELQLVPMSLSCLSFGLSCPSSWSLGSIETHPSAKRREMLRPTRKTAHLGWRSKEWLLYHQEIIVLKHFHVYVSICRKHFLKALRQVRYTCCGPFVLLLRARTSLLYWGFELFYIVEYHYH